MTNLELAICEAENSGEIDLDTRDMMLNVLNESTGQQRQVEKLHSEIKRKEGLISKLNDIKKRSRKEDFGASSISRFPEVLVVRKSEDDEELLWSYVKAVCDEAIDRFVAMRTTEGAKMKDDIYSRGQFILDCVGYIEERSPQTVKEYNDKLVQRVHDLLGEVSLDESRILQEVAIYADKVAVAEETVRLRSHIDQLNAFISSNEPVGRKMDFLVQEINRETNTIGSKANDVDIARKVVDIKAEVEKIREQIQNIE